MKPRNIMTFDDHRSGIMKTCCCCLDIRTGTIVLGMFHLMLHMAGMVVLTQMLLHPQMYKDIYIEGYGVTRSVDASLGLMITGSSFIITIMLIYGTITRKPGYLLPFFCLQVFDFVINMLGAVGLFYYPDLRTSLQANRNPFSDKATDELEPRDLLLMAVTVSVIIFTIKAYMIACVWSCYKMLVHQVQQQYLTNLTQEMTQDPDCENAMLLPPYEEAVKDTPKESPPPYTADN